MIYNVFVKIREYQNITKMTFRSVKPTIWEDAHFCVIWFEIVGSTSNVRPQAMRTNFIPTQRIRTLKSNRKSNFEKKSLLYNRSNELPVYNILLNIRRCRVSKLLRKSTSSNIKWNTFFNTINNKSFRNFNSYSIFHLNRSNEATIFYFMISFKKKVQWSNWLQIVVLSSDSWILKVNEDVSQKGYSLFICTKMKNCNQQQSFKTTMLMSRFNS